METAIRWSPNSTLAEQRFLFADVSGRSFNRGRVKQYDTRSKPSLDYELAPAYRKVPTFRALDWAPFDENLVAVGTPSGETSVLRIDDSGPPISFPARYQRLCNAVAFGRTGLLATGLERVRNDFCLNIWDVNERLALPSSAGAHGKVFVEPSRKLASSEAISSIKFVSAQPQVLVVGVKGVGVRIYDLRESTGNPALQYQTTCAHNIAVDPLDENYFACAGPQKDTTIQIWDCRYGSPYVASALGSSHGSSAGSSIDHSPQGGPVIAYPDIFNRSKVNGGKPIAQAMIWSLRYCKGKRGYLGALASNGDFRVFETQQAHVEAQYRQHEMQRRVEPTSVPGEPMTRMFTRRSYQAERAFDAPAHLRAEKERIVSFDFTNLAGSKGSPCAIILRGDQSISILELHGAPSALSFSSLGELAVTRPRSHKIESRGDLSGEDFLHTTVCCIRSLENSSAIESQSPVGSSSNRNRVSHPVGAGKDKNHENHLSSRELHERRFGILDDSHKLDVKEALALSTIARQRCAKGYLFDCEKNIHVVGENQWLQSMWAWIQSVFFPTFILQV